MPRIVKCGLIQTSMACSVDEKVETIRRCRAMIVPSVWWEPLGLVTWLNHVSPEANSIQIEVEKRVRQGPPPDPHLRSAWREVYEDLVWSLINDREFVWIP